MEHYALIIVSDECFFMKGILFDRNRFRISSYAECNAVESLYFDINIGIEIEISNQDSCKSWEYPYTD